MQFQNQLINNSSKHSPAYCLPDVDLQFIMNHSQTIEVSLDSVDAQPAPQTAIPSHYLLILLLLIVSMVYLRLRKAKSANRNRIVLVGERNSGKTQLWINLNGGKKTATGPSIHNNKTTWREGNKKYEIVDYIGDNISKDEIVSTLQSVHCIVHVIDGTDDKTLADAAMFLYRVLVSKVYQKEECGYILFLNKSDATGYIGKAAAERKLEDEMEHIKQSRIKGGDEDNEAEEDYIKLSKTRFKLPFKVMEGSALGDVKDLKMTVENL